jgi:hypothetical protein
VGTPVRLIPAITIASLLLAGCASGTPGSTGSQGPPGASVGSLSPSAGAPSAPSASAIDHATGATDLLLRLNVGGGFLPPGFLVTEAPAFSLYGDGTVIFRDDSAAPPSVIGSVARKGPFQTAHLSEEQVQATLASAIGPGGLGSARDTYDAPVADAPTTTFTLKAGGLHKTVAIAALGIDTTGGPDGAERAAFARLAQQLARFDGGGQLTTTLYAPARYRGVLGEATDPVSGTVQLWPWPDLTPADWKPAADPGLGSMRRTMTPAEVATLGIPAVEGGFTGLWLHSPAGVLFTFSLRPLLPDEPA